MEIPKGGLIGKSVAYLRRLQEMGIPGHAANAGYFIVLSVFPMLVLVLSILRYTDLDAGDLLDLLSGYLPQALEAAAERFVVQTYAHTSAAAVSVSAVGALWSASRGIYGILRGLNAIYGVEEDRGYFFTRSISVFYTFAFLVVLLLSLALNVFGEYLLSGATYRFGPVWGLIKAVFSCRFAVMLVLQTLVFAAMFTVLPNRKNSFRASLPGAVLASVGWLVFSDLFSVYVEKFAGYSNIYGSVYAVALGMLWLYCCLSILFYGGALNRLLERWE